MSERVLVTLENGLQVLTLNRPDKKNALTSDMYDALADGIERGERDPSTRVTMITGTGSAFTAGHDMGDFANQNAAPVDEAPAGQAGGARFFENMRLAEKPVVAAVNGLAVGIGVTMLLHCDLVYAAESATFQMPFVRLGLVPELGSTHLLPHLVGMQKANELFLMSRKITAAEALAMGLIAGVFADDALPGEALAHARSLAAMPPNAVKITKALLKNRDRDLVASQAEAEGAHLARQVRSAEVKEAVSAFFEKRPADFSKVS